MTKPPRPDTDVLIIWPPFTLPYQVPMTGEAAAFARQLAEAEQVVRLIRETAELALRTASREHLENQALRRRLARRRPQYWLRRGATGRPGGVRP